MIFQFKDELKRTLVKAELVQETENVSYLSVYKYTVSLLFVLHSVLLISLCFSLICI